MFNVPKTLGVGRVADNPKAVLVIFERELTDDELRALHDLLTGRQVAEAQIARRRRDD